MSHDAAVEGIGMGVGPDGTNVPAVILTARDEYLPIFITSDQAQSIRHSLSGEPFERPLTHDLLVEMVTEFGGEIDNTDELSRVLALETRPGQTVPIRVLRDGEEIVVDMTLGTLPDA